MAHRLLAAATSSAAALVVSAGLLAPAAPAAPAAAAVPASVPASAPAASSARQALSLPGAGSTTTAGRHALVPGALSQDKKDDLEQTVSDSEPASTDQVLFHQGHLDIGPRIADGRWTLQIRDDSGDKPVWRRLSDTVVLVKDETRLTVPEDETYRFIGQPPGTSVYVLPQTEKQGVPWPGWNTQSPGALKTMGKGADFTLDRVSGPGDVLMYLENGTLEKPQVLWDSRKKERQNIFAEANSHTHANWVFTKPGVYALQVTSSAKTKDGKTVKDTQVLRFAVGSATDPAPGFAADPFHGQAQAADSEQAETVPATAVAWAVAGSVVLLVGAAVVVGVRRRRRLLEAEEGRS
ncbi:choice-of-anchor M domain-containing protein [Arthrobacter sp. UM1]|uniref:choice-of-anchor M domain-containing protein n=1 Tax=Arthrobacter sp. UM1 TaxID=2766776 RepID=UPI001CF717ED|nr:choice-of-anchor M domain-containing protein [Arthrobacter sp. UM1]MCB4208428.1 choice-of-anchor M domain-containing protein [Arthrobacter sp. UM1]